MFEQQDINAPGDSFNRNKFDSSLSYQENGYTTKDVKSVS